LGTIFPLPALPVESRAKTVFTPCNKIKTRQNGPRTFGRIEEGGC
jgi:hypothetical protein